MGRTQHFKFRITRFRFNELRQNYVFLKDFVLPV